ncbi:MAG: hypothetical protein KBT47_03750, partial [Armatimonadetes bacterium]|nr:hypothetical protein [Candidatus Hippobium faecium]
KGEVRDTPWQKNIARNVVSCPTPQYKGAFVGEVTEIMKKLDFDALYIDQLGSTGIYPCFNQKHDHPLGGGTHWVSSYIDLIETLRKDLGEIKGTPVPFTTEDAADGFTFDGWLRCNEGMWETADAPVNTVVFSGYNLSFGDTYYEEELKTDRSQPAINKLAVDFSKGIIPGWEIGAEMNVVPYAEFRDYYRDMVHARYKAKEFFNFGEMVREVKITSPIPTKKILWKHYTGESTEIFPLVRSVSYKYRNRTMVGFTSIALNDPIKISWEADSEDLYLPKKNMYTIKEIYPREKTLCKSEDIKYTFTIKPKTTVLFTVE